MANGNATGQGGGSSYGPGSDSGLSKLGVDERVVRGTTGDRPDSSFAKYGGKKRDGVSFIGKSAAPVSKNMNSGAGEKKSSQNQFALPSSNAPGTVTARMNMTIGGGKSSGGKMPGQDKLPDSSSAKLFGGLKVQQRDGFLGGTADNIGPKARSMKGVKKTQKTD